MTMNRILIGAAVLAMTVPAMAQVSAPQTPMTPRVDTTQTRDQAIAKVRDRFARMDVNRDGFVAGDEMQAMRGNRQIGERRGRGGGRMAQGKGVGRDPAKAFDRIGANRDGMISRGEFATGREPRIERKLAINGAPGAAGSAMDGHHQGMRQMHRMGGKMRGHMLRMADVDKDGRVSLQEATNSALQRFDRVDANRDGRITPDERQSHGEQRMQMRAPKAG